LAPALKSQGSEQKDLVSVRVRARVRVGVRVRLGLGLGLGLAEGPGHAERHAALGRSVLRPADVVLLRVGVRVGLGLGLGIGLEVRVKFRVKLRVRVRVRVRVLLHVELLREEGGVECGRGHLMRVRDRDRARAQ